MAGGEHQVYGGEQRILPLLYRTDCGGRPVEGANAVGHFSASEDGRGAAIARRTRWYRGRWDGCQARLLGHLAQGPPAGLLHSTKSISVTVQYLASSLAQDMTCAF